MHKLVIFIFLLSMAPLEARLFCATRTALKYKSSVASYKNDKTMHCTLSCIMAVKCPNTNALLLGYIKELWDLVSPGDADPQDIVANEQGIDFSYQASNFDECEELCFEVYPNY